MPLHDFDKFAEENAALHHPLHLLQEKTMEEAKLSVPIVSNTTAEAEVEPPQTFQHPLFRGSAPATKTQKVHELGQRFRRQRKHRRGLAHLQSGTFVVVVLHIPEHVGVHRRPDFSNGTATW